MRNSKIVALVATAALLVLGAAFTAFAATGWVQENGVWKYYDKYGVAVSQEWAKSGSDYYYLDENGEMTVSQIVDDGTNLYYVDETGKMVKNTWEKVDNTSDDDGDEYYWYYFQANGKAVKFDSLKLKTVNGKKYIFNEYGQMQYGWIGGTATGEDAWTDAKYYAGGQDDGAVRVSVWKQIEVIDNRDSSGVIDQTYWFYFGSDGKKVAASTDSLLQKTINGKTYVFDDCGVMLSSWEQAASTATTAASSISSYYYFKSSDDGAKLKKSWFRVAPTSGVNADDADTETPHWFYANGDGSIAKNEIKSIKGKKYLFNTNGEMVAGLVVLNSDGTLAYAIDEAAEVSYVSAAGAPELIVAYFGDEETDGSMKTGTVKTSIDGDDYTILISTTGANKGHAVNGLKSNAWYENGFKLCADGDLKVQAFPCTFTTAGVIEDVEGAALTQAQAIANDYTANPCCLITSSGALIKTATTKKDADGLKYTVANYAVTNATY